MMNIVYLQIRLLDNGITEKSTRKIAYIKLVNQLRYHHFNEEQSDRVHKYKVWARNPIQQPLPSLDKGFYDVDCTTDISDYDVDYVANMVLKVSDRPTNSFMQQIRRRLSILERPLVTARGGGKSYIYSNFNPKYAQMAVTILRTYYNFCFGIKMNGKVYTPAQLLGITTKQFTLNDIIYIK
ncbi:hypothetical protein [Bacillus alkalicellulosilyticus]|uniref:hypothetical protein n=1 Tax=Alkalihalobacterium alkalicellulosilyticum TaxID=1912214 RepID=UPI0011172130|nr:hypothetical protein [Bacillus alkalicellulosilyticus]